LYVGGNVTGPSKWNGNAKPLDICWFNCKLLMNVGHLVKPKYLIHSIELLVLPLPCELSGVLIVEIDSVIEITDPYNRVVVFDSFIPLKLEAMVNSIVVSVSLLYAHGPCCKMSTDKTDPRV
jgi:hypothetical protein